MSERKTRSKHLVDLVDIDSLITLGFNFDQPSYLQNKDSKIFKIYVGYVGGVNGVGRHLVVGESIRERIKNKDRKHLVRNWFFLEAIGVDSYSDEADLSELENIAQTVVSPAHKLPGRKLRDRLLDYLK